MCVRNFGMHLKMETWLSAYAHPWVTGLPLKRAPSSFSFPQSVPIISTGKSSSLQASTPMCESRLGAWPQSGEEQAFCPRTFRACKISWRWRTGHGTSSLTSVLLTIPSGRDQPVLHGFNVFCTSIKHGVSKGSFLDAVEGAYSPAFCFWYRPTWCSWECSNHTKQDVAVECGQMFHQVQPLKALTYRDWKLFHKSGKYVGLQRLLETYQPYLTYTQ